MEITLLVLLALAMLGLFVALGVEDSRHAETFSREVRYIDTPMVTVTPWDESLPRRRPLQHDYTA